MQEKTPQYRALPFIFAGLLLIAAFLFNNWYFQARQEVSTNFNPLTYAAYGAIAPLLFAFLSLLLMASTFNRRLTPAGSIVLLAIGALLCIQPILVMSGLLGAFMPYIVTPWLPLAGALMVVSGFAGLTLKS